MSLDAHTALLGRARLGNLMLGAGTLTLEERPEHGYMAPAQSGRVKQD